MEWWTWHWWETLAVVVLCLLVVLLIFRGLGEAFALPTPFVPRAVLVAVGMVYGELRLAFLLSAREVV